MKTRYILIGLCILLTVSCTGNKAAKELFARVDSIMNEQPDSVLTLLDSARVSKESWHKAQQMRYELLYAKAQNKAYVDFTTDSIMKDVAAYYDAHGTANEQMEAHYLLGCTYRDLHESPMALSCYLDATEKADTLSEDCDYGTLMRIWGQVANEFNNQSMPYKELEALEKYRKYALKSKNTFDYIVGVELDRRVYSLMQDTISTIKTTEKAYRLFIKYGFERDAAISVLPAVPFCLSQEHSKKAKEFMAFYDTSSGYVKSNGNIIEGQEHYYYIKGMYYEYFNELDSAECMYRKLLKYDYKFDAYKGLLSISNKRHNTDSICKYSELKEEAFAESYTHLHTQAMFNADGMFNYSRNQRIAMEKEKEAERLRIRAIIVGLIGLCIMIVGLTLFIEYKKRKRKELQTILSQYVEAREEYNKAVADYALMEKDFEAYKAMKAMEIEQLHESNKIASYAYERTHRQDILASLCSHDAVKHILKNENIGHNHHSEITSNQWDDLYNLFKEEVPHLYNTYINNQQLSDRERKTLALICLGINTKKIAILLNTAASNISNIKTNINQKLFSDGSAKTLYDNIIFA